jgi:hypothetical protein
VFTRHSNNTYDVSTGGGSEGHGGTDLLMWRNFFRCLDGEEEPPATPTDAKKASAIALAAERAIVEDEIVHIDSNFDLI